MSSRKNRQSTLDDVPAVLVIEGNKFERRSLCRLMRAAGADQVAEASDLRAARALVMRRPEPRWLLVADPEQLGDRDLNALRALAGEHGALSILLLTERRHPAAAALQAQARRAALPLAGALRKPVSAEEAGTLLRRLASFEGGPLQTPRLSKEELNECLRAGRLRARFQPQIELHTGRPVACEAFSYVVHARYGEIATAALGFALAQLGAQRMLTASLLREAAGLVRSLREKKIDAQVCVDLSVEMLSEPGDANALDSYVRTLGIAPADLALEVQPGSQDIAAGSLSDNLARLKLRGYKVVLDRADAPGAAMLACFAGVKLQWRRSQGCEDNEPHPLAHALHAAHAGGMTACAFDLETHSDLEQARKAGFELAQGISIAACMDAQEAAAWMEREQRNPRFVTPSKLQTRAG